MKVRPTTPPERDVQVLRLLRVAMLTVAFVYIAFSTAIDPDLWGHVRFGGDIVEDSALQSHDPYSFTSDRAWVNHEWLAEVVMYGAFAAGGGAGLVALKMMIVAAVVGCVLLLFRGRAWRPSDHDFLITVLLYGTLTRYQLVRPQLFSLLLFTALLLVLTMADRGRRAVLLAVPVLFAAWANFHGGYIVGLGVLAVWSAVRFLQSPHHWRALLGVMSGAVLATLLTPYGVDLWRFLWQTVGLSRPGIVDWMPVYGDPHLFLPWLLVVVTALVALWRVRGRVDPAAVGIAAMLCVAAVRVSRIDAFFTIGVVMLLGPAFGRAPVSTARLPGWRPWVAGTAVLMFLSATLASAGRAVCIDVEPALPKGWVRQFFPIRPPSLSVPEPEAAAFLRNLRGRMLTFFDWGEYSIWHLPNLKVSMDGRRETVYSNELIEAHLAFYFGSSTALVHRLNPDVIWIPRDLPVVARLEQEGWRASFRGPVSTVLVRDASSAAREVDRIWPGPRCFPSE